MTPRRLYVPNLPDEGGLIRLGESPSRHVRVLRLREGDRLELFDGRGRSARARLETLGDSVTCRVQPPVDRELARTRLVLMLGVPKGTKLNDCIRMATELGVDEVALMQTERTVPRWDAGRARSRIDRLTRIAGEAAAQCERCDLPIVHAPRPCQAWLDEVPPRAFGVLFGARAKASLRLGHTPEQVWCAVGPEGGFTEDEIVLFERAGFVVASLGDGILRVETAVPAALAVVRDRLDAVRQGR